MGGHFRAKVLPAVARLSVERNAEVDLERHIRSHWGQTEQKPDIGADLEVLAELDLGEEDQPDAMLLLGHRWRVAQIVHNAEPLGAYSETLPQIILKLHA